MDATKSLLDDTDMDITAAETMGMEILAVKRHRTLEEVVKFESHFKFLNNRISNELLQVNFKYTPSLVIIMI